MIEIDYRLAEVSDAEAIADVEVRSKRDSIAELENEPSMDHARCSKRWAGYLAGTRHPKLARRERATWVACEASSIVGFLGCHHAERQDWWPADAELQQVYVLKTHQRLGIGQQLFTRMVQWLRETAVNSVGVGFHAENPYRAFYLKMGGQPTGPGMYFWDDLASWAGRLRGSRDNIT
ncbi:MAG: GNAT family N-acetyltransferase [Planctomycetota bacterium]